MLTRLGKKILIASFIIIFLPIAASASESDEFYWNELQWDEWNRETFLSMYDGFKRFSIFVTALELKIFPTLGTQWLSAIQVAKCLNTDIKATEILLNILTGMDFLTKKDNLFANTERTSKLFCSESKNRDVQLDFIVEMWKKNARLTELVKSGALDIKDEISKENISYSEGVYPWRWTLLGYAFKSDGDSIASLVNCSDVDTMLDLGGGCGYYSIAFARHYPHLKVTLFELNDYFLEIAKKSIERYKLEDKITLKQGDFFRDDLGGKYDIILISYIIHMFPEKHNLHLFNRAKQSLKKGGRIVIHDCLLNDSKTDSITCCYAIDTEFLLQGYKVNILYSYSEVENWLISLGFKNIKRINDLGLIIGEY